MSSSLVVKLLLFFFYFFMSVQSLDAAGRQNPLFGSLLSRTDMVEMAGYGEEKLSSVLVSGTVLCKACLDTDHTELRAWPVSGASVTVTCKTVGKSRRNQMSQAQGTADEYGDFIVDLPSHLHANPNLEKACTVRVTRLPKKSPCSGRVFIRKPKGIRLSSVGNGIRMYTAGSITLKQSSKPCRRLRLNKRGNTKEKTSW